MQKLVLALLSVITLLGLVIPATSSAIERVEAVERDTNANRLARGLPVLPPVRRTGAYQPSHSQVAVHEPPVQYVHITLSPLRASVLSDIDSKYNVVSQTTTTTVPGSTTSRSAPVPVGQLAPSFGLSSFRSFFTFNCEGSDWIHFPCGSVHRLVTVSASLVMALLRCSMTPALTACSAL